VQLVVRQHGRTEGHDRRGSLLCFKNSEHRVSEDELSHLDRVGDEPRACPFLRKHAIGPEIFNHQPQRVLLLRPEQLHGQCVRCLLLRPELRLQQCPPVTLEGELLRLLVAAEASDELVRYTELWSKI
jgi:hypothetical protein